ncbi:unnamed protein product, partial [marine sediment metagenome]
DIFGPATGSPITGGIHLGGGDCTTLGTISGGKIYYTTTAVYTGTSCNNHTVHNIDIRGATTGISIITGSKNIAYESIFVDDVGTNVTDDGTDTEIGTILDLD